MAVGARRLLVALLLAASGSSRIMDALDCGMAGGAGIVHGVARLSGRCLGRAQFGGQIGVGFGNCGDRGAVELLLRGLGQKVDGLLGGYHGTLGQYRLVNVVEARMLGVRGANLGLRVPTKASTPGTRRRYSEKSSPESVPR